jgi:hypothetical protein
VIAYLVKRLFPPDYAEQPMISNGTQFAAFIVHNSQKAAYIHKADLSSNNGQVNT